MMDHLGKNDDYRNRNRSRDSLSKNERYQSHDRHDVNSSNGNRSNGNSNSRRSRSRSPRSRSKSKTRQFYDSSQRNHTLSQHNGNQYNHQQQRNCGGNSGSHYNRQESVESMGYISSRNGTGYYSSHEHGQQMGKPFNPGQPSKTIMLRQLPYELDDPDLRTEFNMQCIPYKDLRLVKNRDNGRSRGFAFVEFNSVEEAQRWMSQTQGWLMFPNYDNKVQMFYSSSREDQNSERGILNDWECAKCGIKNFKRRDRCFKCSITREESERRNGGEGFDHTGNTPCNTLVLRGLDALTSEETLLGIINKHTNFCLMIKNCYIARDPFTHGSRGFAFVEMNSIQEATNLIDIISPNLEVDGKQIVVNFSKNSFSTALTQLNIENRLDVHTTDTKSSNIAYSSYNSNQNVKKSGGPRKNQADQANSAAAVAQAAMQSMQKKQELISHLASQMKQEEMIQNQQMYGSVDPRQNLDAHIGSNLKILAKQADVSSKVYPTPDPSKFAYDETSGYYYDYTTGFYYDANSQYYYNSMTLQYMYWDAAKSTYIPYEQSGVCETAASSTAVSNTERTESASPEPVEKEKSKPAAVKTAAQIAKDMEKWAKSQNTKKSSVAIKKPQAAKPAQQQPAAFVVQSTVKNTFESIDKPVTETVEVEKKESLEQEHEKIIKSDEESNHSNESQEKNAKSLEVENLLKSLIDTSKLACLLCKRRFDSNEILNKHIAKSDLHKKNLEKFKEENGIVETEEKLEKSEPDTDSLQAALKYRDRASERRIKYGAPEPPSPTDYSRSYSNSKKSKRRDKKREHDEDDDAPPQKIYTNVNTSTSLLDNTESVASKLMRKMGWSEGSGIGKNLQGISAPIEATMRAKGAGIGAEGVYDMDPNDSYSDAVRKSARARYDQIK